MAENIKKFIVALLTGVGSWILLSFIFFPVATSTAPQMYFTETMANMAPLKAMITTVFVLFSIFLVEQKQKKKLKAANKNKIDS